MKDNKEIKSEIEKLLKELKKIDQQNDEWVLRNGWLTALRWVLDEEEDEV